MLKLCGTVLNSVLDHCPPQGPVRSCSGIQPDGETAIRVANLKDVFPLWVLDVNQLALAVNVVPAFHSVARAVFVVHEDLKDQTQEEQRKKTTIKNNKVR